MCLTGTQFWERLAFFKRDGLHPNCRGASMLAKNIGEACNGVWHLTLPFEYFNGLRFYPTRKSAAIVYPSELEHWVLIETKVSPNFGVAYLMFCIQSVMSCFRRSTCMKNCRDVNWNNLSAMLLSWQIPPSSVLKMALFNVRSLLNKTFSLMTSERKLYLCS